MWTWHVAEMAASAVRTFQRRLQKLGATDIQTPLPGFVLWKGDGEWDASLRKAGGVRLVAVIGEEEVQQMGTRANMPAEVVIGETVSVPCGSLRMVGRVDELREGMATIVAACFGRPIKVTVPQTDLQPVKLPEVWR